MLFDSGKKWKNNMLCFHAWLKILSELKKGKIFLSGASGSQKIRKLYMTDSDMLRGL